MNLWMKNTTFLKKNYPDFYARTASQDYSCQDLQITVGSENNLLLQKDQGLCYLHSNYSVAREMNRLFAEVTDDPDQILLIFGLGMGHCLDYIHENKLKYRQVMVLEPYNNIFRKLLERRDLATLLNVKDVSLNLFKNPLEIIPQIMELAMSSRKVKVLFHLTYRTLYDELFQEISRLFSNEKRAFLMSASTLNHFMRAWAENQIKSIARQNPSSAILYNKFSGIPAVILSAGPSLEKRLDEIREIQDRALVIAPGTGAKICKERNITAHIGMAMDSAFEEVELFQDSAIGVLIGSYRLHPKMDTTFPNRILRMIISNDHIAKYYHEYNNLPQKIINDHASVSSSAIDFAVNLGCNPIILVGQDMCFYDNRVHAGEEAGSLSDSIRTRYTEARDINGEIVYTDSPFLAMQRDMEMINHVYKDTHKIINATEAGLGIPGVENMKLQEVIDLYITADNKDVAAIIAEALKDVDTINERESMDVEDFYRHMLEELNQLEMLNLEKKKELEKLESMINKGLKDNRLSSQLYFIQEKNEQLQQSRFYQMVIVPTIMYFMPFYQAGVKYEFKGKLDDPRAWLYYENNYFDLSNRYINIIKSMVLKEIGIPDELQESAWVEEVTITLPFNNF